MRDLANQNYSSTGSGKISISRSTLRIALILIVVLAVLFIIKSFASSSGIGGSSIVLKDAPKGLTPVSIAGTAKSTDGAINLAVENASFKNVSDQPGSATASRKYGDGSYALTVNATLAETNDKYQVWIVADAIKLAGTLAGSGKNLSLAFNDKDNNYSKADEVWITREITSNDQKPEKHILEGSF